MNKTLQFKKPKFVLYELGKKYNCKETYLLRGKLKGAKCKSDRELFYGALFAESLNKISDHEYLIHMPEEDKDCDCELLDYTEFQMGLKSPNTRKFNHFLLQNTQITEHDINGKIKKGITNIYDILKFHLIRTKLSKKAGDYLGCILVFYLSLKINGEISLKKLRETVRSIEQDNFQQIWIVVPNKTKYTIAELLISEDESHIADFSN